MTRTFTPDEIAALIAKLEAATGTDRELDCDIAICFGLSWDYGVSWRGWGYDEQDRPIEKPVAFPYTASLDAAARLIPEGLYWIIGYGKTREAEPLGGATIYDPADFKNPISEGEAPTVAIALCIAALKARASIREKD